MDILNQILSNNRSWFCSVAEVTGYVFLISFIIFHFIIYLGRRKFIEGKYHFYFSSFFLGLLLYIFTDTFTFYAIIPKMIVKSWYIFILAICFLIIYKSIILILNASLELPCKTKKYINRVFNYYALFNITWIAPVFFEIKHLFNIFWIINFLFIACLSVVYFRYFITNYKKTENSIKLIVWLMLGYILYIMLYRTSWIVFPGAFSYLPLWIVNDSLKLVILFTFAYALAKKTNKEFIDLQELKIGLEKKVEEKTLELRQAKERIEEINEQRSQYFINVAHETKTPLTLISNYLDRYIKIWGSSRELEVIKENFDKLKNDMLHFLDIEKYEKGLITYNHDNIIDISGIIKQKKPLYEEHARINNLSVTFDLDDEVFVKSNPSALERIINNLFENAVRYSKKNGEIKILLRREDGKAILKVKDNGRGIEKEKLDRIFQPYYQITHPGKNNQGLGMGLFIVKSIVDSLNGTIDVQSEVNIGSEVIISLPCVTGDVKFAAAEPSAESIMLKKETELIYEPDMLEERKTIVIVEDNKDMRHYLEEELTSVFNVLSAEDGNEALRLLKLNSGVDLILSDVMMEGMDGYAFYDEVSKYEKYSNIPFVFLTARSYNNEKIEMLTRGVSDYLYKPFSIEELKAKIWSVIKNANKHKTAGLKDAITAVQNQMISGQKNGNGKLDILELKKKENNLTNRQIEIIKLLEQGFEYKQIADRLNISVKTVHRHIQILFEKFGVHSKLELLKSLFS